MWQSIRNQILRAWGRPTVENGPATPEGRAGRVVSEPGPSVDTGTSRRSRKKRTAISLSGIRQAASAGEPVTDIGVNIARKTAEYERRVVAEPWLPHPIAQIEVNPHAIRRICALNGETKHRYGRKELDIWTFYGGDWDDCSDQRNVALDCSTTDRSVLARYIAGTPWKESDVFFRKMAAIRRRGKIDGCRDEEQLLDRYRCLDRVFEEICDKGYHRPGLTGPFFDSLGDNISVSIGRYGDFFLGGGGAHRLAIAKMLNLPYIPCLVLTRHADWMERRRRVYEGEDRLAARALRAHPDMQDCIVADTVA